MSSILENAKDLGQGVYTQAEIDSQLLNKADKATTYTKTEVDSEVATAESNAIQANRGFKNYIINGGFDVWQRGTDVIGLAGYLSADRWRIRGVNSSYTEEVSLRALKEASNILLLQTASTNTGFAWIEQGIELSKNLIGRQMTLSFYVMDGDNVLTQGNLSVAIRADSMNVKDAGPITLSSAVNIPTSFTKYTYTFTVPSFNNYLAIGIGLDGIGITTSGITIARFNKIQLEEGSIATSFEHRHYGLELSLCQRYYQLINSGSGYANFGSTTQAQISIIFNQAMRTTPTCLGATNPLVVTDSLANYTSSATSVGNWYGTATGGVLQLHNFTGLTSFRPAMLNPQAGTNNPSIMFSAEL